MESDWNKWPAEYNELQKTYINSIDQSQQYILIAHETMESRSHAA